MYAHRQPYNLYILILLSCILHLASCFLLPASAQNNLTPQHPLHGNDLPPRHPLLGGEGELLKFPWTGGFNSCQFCEIDLNLDGVNDLLVFDRHGNRRLTFINHGTPNMVDYTFEPAYALQLPELREWVITADYNCDGKMDIFTYGNGGVRVYRNDSGPGLNFTLVTDLLKSFYYTSYIGILVTSVDYPAIADIDGDGDLDLLTFFGLGSYVEYHKNLSMERFGNCDSLDLRLDDHCWGKFRESEGGNRISLNEPCGWDVGGGMWDAGCRMQDAGSKHTGSTLLAIDLNGDGLKDLVLGDVDYPGLTALINGGTKDSAFMISADTLFPAAANPVRIFSFPAAAFIDLDNDGRRDLVVSPFDPALSTADNYNCIWFYKNLGSNSAPEFEFLTDRLLRGETFDFGSASHPLLFDFDNDGLTDLFVGNEGYYDTSYYKEGVLHSTYQTRISCFRNTGTQDQPSYQNLTDDLANLSTLNFSGGYPAFGDLNDDGLADLLTGSADGTLTFFQNQGQDGELPRFTPPLVHWQQIDVGNYSAPQLFDADKDGTLDLIVGEKGGNLNFFINSGTAANPVFTLVTDSLGKVNVANYSVSYDGFSTPCFFLTTSGETLLAAGSDEGRIRFYGNIDNNLDGRFTELEDIYSNIASDPADTLFGWQSSPAIFPLPNGSFEIITGNFSGGLNFIGKRTPPVIIPGVAEYPSTLHHKFQVFPNPAHEQITIKFPGYTGILLIINSLGQAVSSSQLDDEATLNISNLPTGIYILRAGTSCVKLAVL